MLFDQYLLACLAITVTCIGIGFKLMNPAPQRFAPLAFLTSGFFALLAVARYLQTDPDLQIDPRRSLPWLLSLLVIAGILAFRVQIVSRFRRAWVLAKNVQLRSPIVWLVEVRRLGTPSPAIHPATPSRPTLALPQERPAVAEVVKQAKRKPHFAKDEIELMIRSLGRMEDIRENVCGRGYGAVGEATNMWGRIVDARGDVGALLAEMKRAHVGIVDGWKQLTAVVAENNNRYAAMLEPALAGGAEPSRLMQDILETVIDDLTEIDKAKGTGMRYDRFVKRTFEQWHPRMEGYGRWFGACLTSIKAKTEELRNWHND